MCEDADSSRISLVLSKVGLLKPVTSRQRRRRCDRSANRVRFACLRPRVRSAHGFSLSSLLPLFSCSFFSRAVQQVVAAEQTFVEKRGERGTAKPRECSVVTTPQGGTKAVRGWARFRRRKKLKSGILQKLLVAGGFLLFVLFAAPSAPVTRANVFSFFLSNLCFVSPTACSHLCRHGSGNREAAAALITLRDERVCGPHSWRTGPGID